MSYKLKSIYYIASVVLFLTVAQLGFAQDQPARRTRVRPSEAAATTSSVINLTERAAIKNEEVSQKPNHIVWERVIYRTIDLTQYDNNAALYYPVQPLDNRQNLFTLIFKLLADGKISAYDYERGEGFPESQKIDFEGKLKTLQVLYTKEGNRFVVDERDIPSPDVTQYIVKEGYYFDQTTGMFQTSVIALCPVLVREDYYSGGLSKETFGWLKYDDLRPYLSRELIMTSNRNNALTNTMDDYFRKNMYTGDIIKTVNMMGKSLAQEVGSDPEKLKLAQDSIEAQLKGFDQNLWIYNDSTFLKKEAAKDVKAEKKTTSGKAVRTNSGSGTEKAATTPKAKTASEPKVKAASSPSRSVRRK
ncbi:hypothetical protein FACS1894162_6850 [Bacteroidia bacterium]|nr:hypothetical protein FACS1894162_6850 [Bacteroidia bacterium]